MSVDPQLLNVSNLSFVEELYARFTRDPSSVDPSCASTSKVSPVPMDMPKSAHLSLKEHSSIRLALSRLPHNMPTGRPRLWTKPTSNSANSNKIVWISLSAPIAFVDI